jgi:UPF0755 protein
VRRQNWEATGWADSHDLLFGDEEYADADDPELNAAHHAPPSVNYPDHPSGPRPAARESLVETRRERDRRALPNRRRRSWGIMIAVAAILVALVAGVGWFAVRPIWHYFHPSDYSGMGTGSVQVVVHPGDTTTDIGQTLLSDGVVASTRAFTDAASGNSNAVNIQPGAYVLHRQMSAQNALNLLLSPSSRISSDVTIPEGATIFDVEKRLTAPRCTAKSLPGTKCGLGLPKAAVVHALENVSALGLPTDYAADGTAPRSAEGFLYPATYPFDDKTTAASALGQMTSTFTDEVRKISFTSRAKSLGLTPYQELIVASIAQAEAKFPADMPKVTRVIFNRLAAHRNLQIDATSVYGARLQGLDASKQIHAQTRGPYNTYTNPGLPPTPIDNPGEAALNAAAHPAKGDWLYYVNGDAAGHLAFFSSENRFEKAVQRCRAHGWCQ